MADFGLSQHTYDKTYFRQDKTACVKLPVKWLSLESMVDGIFSEKTDVVREILPALFYSISNDLFLTYYVSDISYMPNEALNSNFWNYTDVSDTPNEALNSGFAMS